MSDSTSALLDAMPCSRGSNRQRLFGWPCVSRVAILLVALFGLDSGTGQWPVIQAADTKPTIVPIAASAADVVQPAIRLSVKPENPRAGTRVQVTVETTGIDDESSLNWTFPQVSDSDGTPFDAAAIVAADGRSCEIVWPEGGEYPIRVETLLIEVRVIPGVDGQPDRLIPTKWQVVQGDLTLTLRGGVEPEPPDVETARPAVDLESLVTPIRDALVSAGARSEARQLYDLFREAADLVDRDSAGKILTRTSHVRELNRRAGTLLAQPNKLGPVGLAKLCEAPMQAKLGLDDRELTAELRTATAAVFRAQAWACYQASKRK